VAATIEAARILRGGGFALLAVDGVGTARVPVTLFGTETSVSAGAFALARLAGAPVLPIAVRWQGSGVRFDTGDLIPSGAAEEMAASVAAWLEGYLDRNPGELTPPVAKLLSSAPAA
jgi:lauroyl/myristoyl acyltransferase